MDSACHELVQFLKLGTRLEVKLVATKNVLALTGSPEGRKLILENDKLLEAILTLTKDGNMLVVKDCYLSLVNLSADDHAAKFLMRKYNMFSEFFKVIIDASSQYSDHACIIINNLSRSKEGSEFCLQILNTDKIPLSLLLEVFCNIGYNKSSCNLDYLGSLFANLTQLNEGRKFFLGSTISNINRIISFLQYSGSSLRRGAAALVLRNCCFEYDKHKWLLSDDVNLLSHLLLSLAGPEEFDDEDLEKFPIDLQYLPSDKQREPDQDIRKILIECIILLCATKFGRQFIISCNTYVLIRELHKWEEANNVQEVVSDCNKLIQILLTDEPDLGNLLTYEIPENHKKLLSEV